MRSVIEGAYLYRVLDGCGTDMFISLVFGKGLIFSITRGKQIYFIA